MGRVRIGLFPANDEPAHQVGERVLWKCHCGSTIFELQPHDIFCVKCREPVRGYPDGCPQCA